MFSKRKVRELKDGPDNFTHNAQQVKRIFFFFKTETELPYEPAIQLLGIYLEKTIIGKDTCIPVFI